jgi:hypothetical protein
MAIESLVPVGETDLRALDDHAPYASSRRMTIADEGHSDANCAVAAMCSGSHWEA